MYDATEGLAGAARDASTVTAYIGFDPTASSLHVGSLLPVMALARLQRFGHTPIAIVGGGTGMIGDPSGKSQERMLLSREQIDAERRRHRAQLARFLDFDARQSGAHRQQRRLAWRPIDLLAFLRDTGKHFTVNYMLQKESVNRRLESEDGISFTEFSYLLLQAHDFLAAVRSLRLHAADGRQRSVGQHHRRHRSDSQAARRRKAHGLVMPLVTTASGAKFGKTEAGAIWLDAAAHVAVCLLSVLAEYRRSRRRRVSADSSRS